MRAMPDRNPAHADVFVSCSGDNTARVWDTRQPRATLTIPAHQHEVHTALPPLQIVVAVMSRLPRLLHSRTRAPSACLA